MPLYTLFPGCILTPNSGTPRLSAKTENSPLDIIAQCNNNASERMFYNISMVFVEPRGTTQNQAHHLENLILIYARSYKNYTIVLQTK